jgi:TolB-like protein/Flp pilus assembly protein TadD
MDSALQKALSTVPADRFATVEEFVAALESRFESPPAKRSLAVLPFLNLSADPENEYFADGVTEDVIAQLTKIRALKVISRTSIMRFKERDEDLREIGRTLGVETILEGSVRRAGNRVRIVAQLIDADSDRHLWADTYDHELRDIFEIQTDVAFRIADALRAELTPAERARIGKDPTDNLDAYHLFLKGRRCYHQLTSEGIQKALEYYGQAVEKDPDYALAHTGAAICHLLLGMGFGSGWIRPSEAYTNAKAAAQKALAVDDSLGEAHSAQALVDFVADFDWSKAEGECLRAIELNPGSSVSYDAYGLLLAALGRHDEAIAVRRRAQELDPLAPVISSDLATTLLRAGRYEEALAEAEHLLDIEPDLPTAHSTLAWALIHLGNHEAGLSALKRAAESSAGNTMFLAQLGQAYAVTGREEEARRILNELEEFGRHRYLPPYHLAYVYTGLGEHDKAMDCLERAYEERAGGIYGIKGSFLFRSLRSHPRFEQLLAKMNLA